ncbi:hypothetical protein EPUS_07751 [Endocarpon pusillum Z07020]|uniref:Thiamine-triphosphatase n=1 Tax=Endocarpon pusillum (strain Z07020 / HMAS-L-300199) TaxID=1263415 RepID=U1HPT9_ENDPU|nr:uncharacterized protein EPUS_07751 [Endocarpon pusillum Z07020]ERF71079.1 hypothetical protein EPUS_07751 [Endocarpon pusillum Z07020]
MRQTAARLSRQITLEVERKFRCTVESVNLLRANGGEPPFPELSYLGRKTFSDTYFDKHQKLSSTGIYVRKRDGRWQAKVRQSGDYQNSTFEELAGKDEIGDLVARCTGQASSHSVDFGLSQMAHFTTVRDRWRANRRFEVVLDSASFGHMVGEVELQSVGEVDPVASSRASDSMHAEIEAFMQKYSWAFPPGKADGKLSAYFAHKSSTESIT